MHAVTLAALDSASTTQRVPSRPLSGIGSAIDNQAHLAWLVANGKEDVIKRGCILCRNIGHTFNVACWL